MSAPAFRVSHESFQKTDSLRPNTRPRDSSPQSYGKRRLLLPNNQEKSKEKTEERVLRLITANPRITTAELAAECSLNENTIYKTVRKLRESGRIQRKGGDKGGEWIVLKP